MIFQLPPFVPLHPSADLLQAYRHAAEVALREAIRQTAQGGWLNDGVLDALNAQSDYTIARMRWMADNPLPEGSPHDQ